MGYTKVGLKRTQLNFFPLLEKTVLNIGCSPSNWTHINRGLGLKSQKLNQWKPEFHNERTNLLIVLFIFYSLNHKPPL